jgi:hypothetical protein
MFSMSGMLRIPKDGEKTALHLSLKTFNSLSVQENKSLSQRDAPSLRISGPEGPIVTPNIGKNFWLPQASYSGFSDKLQNIRKKS